MDARSDQLEPRPKRTVCKAERMVKKAAVKRRKG